MGERQPTVYHRAEFTLLPRTGPIYIKQMRTSGDVQGSLLSWARKG